MQTKENDLGSVDAARASVRLAVTPNRAEEEQLIAELREKGIMGAALDVGGEAMDLSHVIIERAILAAKKNGLIKDTQSSDGVVAGAAHEAMSQIMQKAMGFNGGGKVAVCREGTHISVCVFMSVGMMYLNEVVIGLGHRVITE